jgi:lipoprotein-anchoring transpeptidase ErfK/SrfK
MPRALLSIAAFSIIATSAAAQQPLVIVPAAQGYYVQQPVYAQQQQKQPMVVVAQPQAQRPNLGGGFIEFLFNGGQQQPMQQPGSLGAPQNAQPVYANVQPQLDPEATERAQVDPRYLKQVVEYHGKEEPGTVVIDTPNKFLYLVQGNGRAMRYGIGVGRPGFTWSGEHRISAKKEWPDWTPPDEMLVRQPGLPHFVAGGPGNPLGARALYLGSTLYRIHGSNEPWTIGQNVSSGCIRMRNEDVIDLYGRVKVGTRVVVI